MFLEIDEIRSLTSFPAVRDLSDEKLEYYLERADSWIQRATNRDFSQTDDIFIQRDLARASLLLVEYLVYWDDDEIKTAMMGPRDGERLGSYSVSYKNLNTWMRAVPGDNTGIKELDNIIAAYRYSPSAGLFFKVMGKGRP